MEVANDITSRSVPTHDENRVAINRSTIGGDPAPEMGGLEPDDLSEVSAGLRKTSSSEVIARDLVVPLIHGVDHRIGDVCARVQVLAIRATGAAVLEETVARPCGRARRQASIPDEWWRMMKSAKVVME